MSHMDGSRAESDGLPARAGSSGQAHSLNTMLDEDHPLANREISLVDLLDRVLAKGVVLTGDLTISIADVDLVRVSLRALVSSINEDVPSPWEHGHPLSGWIRQDRDPLEREERYGTDEP